MNAPNFFEIQSSNPAREMDFYKAVFGWKFTKVEGLPIEYYLIETEGSPGGLLKRPAAIPPQQCGTNAYCTSMEVRNFDESAATILANGGIVAMPKFAIPGKCWQGYFLDADGNVFGIFEVDPSA